MRIAEELPSDFPRGFPRFIITQSLTSLFNRGPFTRNDIVRMHPATLPLTADFNALARSFRSHHPYLLSKDKEKTPEFSLIDLKTPQVESWAEKLRQSNAPASEQEAIQIACQDMLLAEQQNMEPVLRLIFSFKAFEWLHQDATAEERFMRTYNYKGTVFARGSDVVPRIANADKDNALFVLKEGKTAYQIPVGWYSFHSTGRSNLPTLENGTSAFIHAIPNKKWDDTPRMLLFANRL